MWTQSHNDGNVPIQCAVSVASDRTVYADLARTNSLGKMCRHKWKAVHHVTSQALQLNHGENLEK